MDKYKKQLVRDSLGFAEFHAALIVAGKEVDVSEEVKMADEIEALFNVKATREIIDRQNELSDKIISSLYKKLNLHED